MLSHKQQRKHHRIHHPAGTRPKFIIGKAVYDILDISSGGARISASGPLDVSEDETIEAFIQFSNGDLIPVDGRVVRYEIAIEFSRVLADRTIDREQLRIRLAPETS